MATQDNPPNKIAELPLTAFELPKWLVEPAVRSCRLFNTALDFVFYDVPTLRAALAEKDAPMQARGEKPPSRIIDFDALSDPEGSLLLIDATTAPYVHKYQSVEKFLQSPYQETRDVDIATITGVGSSALGSAALAWDISVALEKPVLAIVPGYGVADLVLQGLGGWFAFGLHDFLSSKTLIQTGLATAATFRTEAGDHSEGLLFLHRRHVIENLCTNLRIAHPGDALVVAEAGHQLAIAAMGAERMHGALQAHQRCGRTGGDLRHHVRAMRIAAFDEVQDPAHLHPRTARDQRGQRDRTAGFCG